MSETIGALYSRYTQDISDAMEHSEYFQYMLQLLEGGENSFFQCNRVLHKRVDEGWITEIENCLGAIESVIAKPRRYLSSNEEVVPIDLAKKISSESVIHLSQHTEYISGVQGGNVIPSKILTVTTEESYDLYENRFVYYLIKRLAAFIEKRTDVIFWNNADELEDVMNLTSRTEDEFEELSYKVELKIKHKNENVQNNEDRMGVYKRIDTLRNAVRALAASSFCETMKGCARIRSPIQRTNLLMKDPQYRKCYALWHFLERYDEVGYSIEEQDTVLEFDEEYLYQMYSNVIANYMVFKSLLLSDPRKAVELEQLVKAPVRPRFLTELPEELEQSRDVVSVLNHEYRVPELAEELSELRKSYDTSALEIADLQEQLEQVTLNMKGEMIAAVNSLKLQLDDAEATLEEKSRMLRAAQEKEERLKTELHTKTASYEALERQLEEQRCQQQQCTQQHEAERQQFLQQQEEASLRYRKLKESSDRTERLLAERSACVEELTKNHFNSERELKEAQKTIKRLEKQLKKAVKANGELKQAQKEIRRLEQQLKEANSAAAENATTMAHRLFRSRFK